MKQLNTQGYAEHIGTASEHGKAYEAPIGPLHADRRLRFADIAGLRANLDRDSLRYARSRTGRFVPAGPGPADETRMISVLPRRLPGPWIVRLGAPEFHQWRSDNGNGKWADTSGSYGLPPGEASRRAVGNVSTIRRWQAIRSIRNRDNG